MKKISIITLILLISAVMLFAEGERDTLYILQTTDIHGTIIPYDYTMDKPAEQGLVKVYTRMKRIQREI